MRETASAHASQTVINHHEPLGTTTLDVSGKPPTCPHQKIIEIYDKTLPECPRVRIWNETRKGYLRSRWRESSDRQSLDWWKKYFEYINQSDFLTGRTNGSNGKPPFIADLEWLIKPNNFAKIIEGKYHRGTE